MRKKTENIANNFKLMILFLFFQVSPSAGTHGGCTLGHMGPSTLWRGLGRKNISSKVCSVFGRYKVTDRKISAHQVLLCEGGFKGGHLEIHWS